MPEPIPTTETTNGVTTEVTPPATDPPAAPVEPPKADEPKEDELPEWARKELAKVRGEAASYRTKLRDAEGNLAKAKTPEEFETAKAELSLRVQELEHSVLVSKVARTHDLPDELAELLKGSTEEELKAHAEKLAKFVSPADPQNLGGGLNPNDSGGAFDPVAAVRAARKRY